MFALIFLLIYSIAFNSSTADSSSPISNLNAIIATASDNCVTGYSTVNNKIYRAKEGYGIKGGTSSIKGEVTLRLDTSYAITRMTVYAAPFIHKNDSAHTKGIHICGQDIRWSTSQLHEYILTMPEGYTTDSIEITALAASYNRFYVSRIEFEATDPTPAHAKVTTPYTLSIDAQLIIDGEPVNDMTDLTISARNASDSLRLSLKYGTNFSISPSALPEKGGEIAIAYTATTQQYYRDTLYIHAAGSDSVTVVRALPLEFYAMTYTAPVIDSIPCNLTYQHASGLSDSLLKSALAEIAYCGSRYRYGSGNRKTWSGFYSTDRDTTDNRVLDMYSNTDRYFNTERPTASVSGFDIEHMFPKSWWGGTVNAAYCDLYHLVPGDYSANRSKSNHAPGYVADTTFWNGSFATGGNSDYPVAKVFCPDDEYKGDFARAYFYIATTYGDSLTWVEKGEPAEAVTNSSWQEFRPWLRDVLLDWHRLDPVSEKELTRAEEVYKIQGNRNPYIDYPELAEYIWGNMQGETWLYTPVPTHVRQTEKQAAVKVLLNGQLLIIRDGNTYNSLGIRY